MGMLCCIRILMGYVMPHPCCMRVKWRIAHGYIFTAFFRVSTYGTIKAHIPAGQFSVAILLLAGFQHLHQLVLEGIAQISNIFHIDEFLERVLAGQLGTFDNQSIRRKAGGD